MMIKLFPLLLVLFIIGCGASDVRDPFNSTVQFKADVFTQISDSRVSEISGIAPSRQVDNFFWVINDSGDDARLYAINASGIIVAEVKVRDADNIDWEDLASFKMDGESYLLIADVGNNVDPRDVFSLYLVKEPDIQDGKVDWQRRIDFRYSDGSPDCESVAVDAVNKKILLLSKRDVPPVLYELDLLADSGINTAKRVGEVTTIPQPTEDEKKKYLDQFHAQPTALDILPDASKIAILTYRRLFIYDHKLNESYLVSLNRSDRALIEYPALEQAEAMCFYGESVLITTEKLPAEILKISMQ